MIAARMATSQDEGPVPTMSVNDLMVTVMAPATDTLWCIEDPKTDDELQVFIDAANVVIDAGKTIKVGGTGPNDNEWASNPPWDAFADVLVGAGTDECSKRISVSAGPRPLQQIVPAVTSAIANT